MMFARHGVRFSLALFFMFVVPFACHDQAAAQQNNERFDEIALLGGTATNIVVQNNVAFAGIGFMVQIIDVSDLSSAASIGNVLLDRPIRKLILANNRLYVATENSVHIFNIDDPAMTLETGHYKVVPTNNGEPIHDMVIDNSTIYLAMGQDGITILNGSEPAQIQEYVLWQDAPFVSHRMLINNNTLFSIAATAGASTIHAIDVSDRTQPQVSGTFNASWYPISLALYQGQLLSGFMICPPQQDCNPGGIQVIDIQRPAQMKETAVIQDLGSVDNLLIDGNLGYYSRGSSSDIFGVVNLAEKRRVDNISVKNIDSWIEGTRLYLASEREGINVIDISNPNQLAVLGSVTIGVGSMRYQDMVLSQDTLYASAFEGIDLVDVSAKESLYKKFETSYNENISEFEDYSKSSDLTIHGGHLYFARRQVTVNRFFPISTKTVSLSIFEPTHLSAPIGTLELWFESLPPTSGFVAISVVAADKVAYVAQENQVWRVDITSNSHPVLDYEAKLGNVTIEDIALNDQTLYAVSQEAELIVIDVSDATTATHSTTVPLSGEPKSIIINDDTAHVAAGSAGILTVDVSTPASPQLVNSFSPGDSVSSLAMEGQIGYAAGSNGLYVVDMNQPLAPAIIATCSITPHCMATKIAVRGGGLYTIHERGISRLLLEPVVAGTVTDGAGTPIPDIRVTLDNGQQSHTDASGRYVFVDIGVATYSVAPDPTMFEFLPQEISVSVPPNAIDTDFVAIAEAVTARLLPSVSTTLVYSDVLGNITELYFPAGTVSEEIPIQLRPVIPDVQNGVQFANHAFELTINSSSLNRRPVKESGSDFLFQKPVRVTINYSDLDLRPITYEESLRLLRFGQNSEWSPPGIECVHNPGTAVLPKMLLDTVNNRLETEICHTGLYALIGESEISYLPIVTNP